MSKQQDIQIEVKTRYLQEQSDPAADRYAFAYTVEISNRGIETVKLLNRHWHITDDNEKIEEVRGAGVIGQQPEILPGQSFHYTSGAVIETQFGSMHGDYEMQSASGEKFTAVIPPFLLAPPHSVH
ncbi:MAG: Co2+/Mg2+ efflux protein ApaG [Pseudohongiellaceae bacterium]